jgi:hypothetical protein
LLEQHDVIGGGAVAAGEKQIDQRPGAIGRGGGVERPVDAAEIFLGVMRFDLGEGIIGREIVGKRDVADVVGVIDIRKSGIGVGGADVEGSRLGDVLG